MTVTVSLATSMAFVFAVAIALVIVPIVRSLSRRFGIVDRPDPERKLHGKETALCGGIGVFVAAWLAFAVVAWWTTSQGFATFGDSGGRWWVLLAAAAGILLVGLIDDAWALRGRQKLLAQIVILSCVIGGGTLVERVSLFGLEMELGVFAYPLTMLWLLGAVNALNLIDGADGMATTAGLIICAGLGLLNLQTGSLSAGLLSLAMSGALLGFLAYNRPPASIFLGDAGSMMIGLVVGVLSIWGSLKGTTVLAAAPVAVLAIPLFDSFIAILRRTLTGRSIYQTDRAHLHHLLSARFGPRGMLVVVALLSAGTTGAAVAAGYWDQPWIAIVGVILVLGILVMTRSFGHAEISMLLRRMANVAERLVTPSSESEGRTKVQQVQLQGNRQWERVWETFQEFAEKFDLAQIRMDLNVAWLHEGYHGVWSAVRLPEKAQQMTLRLPLVAYDPQIDKDRLLGRIEVIARGDRSDIYDTLERLAGFVAELRPQLTEFLLAEQEEHPHEPKSAVSRDERTEETLVAVGSAPPSMRTPGFGT